MITSSNLCAIPFLGHCDNSRLQMSAKQLSQAVTNPRCEIAKVIGENYTYLSNSSQLFKLTAKYPGEVIYTNDDLMIVHYPQTENGPHTPTYETPAINTCSGLYATRLRYKRDVGPFNVGDVIYEYDCFRQGVPSYGYNLWTAYMSFFGYNHEDALVISEDVANRCRSTKCETILIPIYTHSLYKMNVYPGAFGFIPDVGQELNGQTIAYKSQLKAGRNIMQQLKAMNITDFTSALDNCIAFSTHEITTRVKNGRVTDLRIHRIGGKDQNRALVDKTLQLAIDRIVQSYVVKLQTFIGQLEHTGVPKDMISNQIARNYVLQKKADLSDFDKRELAYLIEVQVTGESTTSIGDKFANRYANKGVVSHIIPNDLRPIAMHSNRPIDSFVGPISVVSRMNFGQVIEGLIGKGVLKAEQNILADVNSAPEQLERLARVADCLDNKAYSGQIRNLATQLNDPDTARQFANSVQELGLYFEAPNFANFNLNELRKTVEDNFNLTAVEPVKVSKELIKYMTQNLKLDVAVPAEDIILPDIFTAPIYTIKLKQEAKYRSTARDFGNYKATNRQPTQGRNKDGLIAQGSRLGQMEFDGLLGHAAVHTMRELRTVKNDSQSLKSDMTLQIMSHGGYSLPQTNSVTSFTKLMIDSLINFLNS